MAKEWTNGFYTSKEWRKTRDAYYRFQCGRCERCMAEVLAGVRRVEDINPGIIVHHKKELTPENINDPAVALSFDNLELLCDEHHNRQHNVYLNKLDQYVKHVLKMKYYVRYMDDFIILSEDPEELRHVLALIEEFLRRELKLELNPKTTILAAKNGINFVGYIHFKDHKRVRKDAMRRLKKLLKAFDTGEVELEDFDRSIESRFGHMKHADSYILIEETKEKVKEIKERKATA